MNRVPKLLGFWKRSQLYVWNYSEKIVLTLVKGFYSFLPIFICHNWRFFKQMCAKKELQKSEKSSNVPKIWQNVKKSVILLAHQIRFRSLNRQYCLQIQHLILMIKDFFLNFGMFLDFIFDSGTRICSRANSTSKYFSSAQCSKTAKSAK